MIPVLVRGAKMPSADQLPEDLKDLAYRNCIELTHARWRSDIQLLIEALRRLMGDPSQTGTSARPSESTGSAQPGAPEKEATGSSKLGDGNSARIDPVALERITQELALRIGPIAGIVVKRAAPLCNSLEELYLKAAEEIDSREEREKSLQERAAIPSNPSLPVARATTVANDRSGGSRLPAPPEGHEIPSEKALPATGVQPSNRRKYVLLASGEACS